MQPSTPTPAPIDPNDLAQAAVRSYLSTVVAVAESMAEVCPDIGLAYQKRLQRIPMRLGFHLSPKTIEESRVSLEAEIKHYSEVTGDYVKGAPAALDRVVTSGATVVDAVADSVRSLVSLLETLADRMDVAVDLEEPAEIRKLLRHQSGGLRMCAGKVGEGILPAVAELQKHLTDCRTKLQSVKEATTVDWTTGLANRLGFEQQLEYWIRKQRTFCLVLLSCEPAAPIAEDYTEEQTGHVIKQIAARLLNEFRPSDVVCHLDLKRFAVIFDGEFAIAEARAPRIARSLSVKYPVKDGEGASKAKFQLTPTVIEAEKLGFEETYSLVFPGESAPKGPELVVERLSEAATK